jgi:hypothetical protein
VHITKAAAAATAGSSISYHKQVLRTPEHQKLQGRNKNGFVGKDADTIQIQANYMMLRCQSVLLKHVKYYCILSLV